MWQFYFSSFLRQKSKGMIICNQTYINNVLVKWSQWSCIIESDDLIHNKILKSTLPINYKRVILVSWSKSPISRPSRIDTLCNNGMCFNLWSVWSKRNSFICSYRLESLSRRKQGRRLCSIIPPHITRAAELSREVSIIPMPMYNSIYTASRILLA